MKGAALASFQSAAAPEARIGGERDDEPMPLTTIIVAEVDADAQPPAVLFRVCHPSQGMSPLYRLARGSADGNPYALYGVKAAEWVGVPSWNHLTLVVAQVTSGSLKT
jgi:hypothetical protein